MGEENLRAMQAVNNFRKMGLAGRTFVNQYGALAHRLDEALSTGDWSKAERNIEELEGIDKGYPGWFMHIGLGLVHEGKFFEVITSGLRMVPVRLIFSQAPLWFCTCSTGPMCGYRGSVHRLDHADVS